MTLPIFVLVIIVLSIIFLYYRSSSPKLNCLLSNTETNHVNGNANGNANGIANGHTVDKLLINKNITYHAYKSPQSSTTRIRPLLILYSWLFAKERHLDKYRKLYFERGFDVLTVKTDISDLLLPAIGSQSIAQNVVEFMERNDAKHNKYVFHAFSVGAYQMGEVFIQMKKKHYSDISEKTQTSLKGIIYDSGMDVNEAPIGLARAATGNLFLQQIISTAMSTYLKIFYNQCTRHYITSSNAVHEHSFRCPTLVLLSRDDEVANYVHTFQIIEKWKKLGIKVYHKCWDNSPHVSHYFKYPQEYQFLVDNFLRDIKVI